MGDPGLGAGDLVDIALAHRPGAQRAEVGAAVGLGEDGGGQDFARAELGQPVGLLLLGAAEADQFGGDLRAGAQRADADIGAAQHLRDQTHGGLAHAQPAILLGHGQAEDAHLGHLLDDRHRDQFVLEVPFVGERHHLIGGEARELVAHHVQGFIVEAEGAEIAALGDQRGDAGAHGAGGAIGNQRGHRGGAGESGHRRRTHPEVGRAGDLDLTERDAAGHLGQILAEDQLEHQLLQLAELSGLAEIAAPAFHLAQALGIGVEPSEAMGRELLAVHQP